MIEFSIHCFIDSLVNPGSDQLFSIFLKDNLMHKYVIDT